MAIKKTGDAEKIISVFDPKQTNAKTFCICGVVAPMTKEAFQKGEKPNQICPACGNPRR